MQRNSTKHGPRLDEEMQTETESLERGAPVESRAEEWREKEGAADGEREPSARTRPQGLDPDEVAARSDLSRHLRLSTFPADRDALLRDARDDGAPEHVLADLSRLPAGQTFGTVHEVWAALGGTVEHVEGRPLRHAEKEETMEPMNREQRRHPKRPAPPETAGAAATGARPPSPEDASMRSASRVQDDHSVRAKNSGHKKKTADKWNQ